MLATGCDSPTVCSGDIRNAENTRLSPTQSRGLSVSVYNVSVSLTISVPRLTTLSHSEKKRCHTKVCVFWARKHTKMCVFAFFFFRIPASPGCFPTTENNPSSGVQSIPTY